MISGTPRDPRPDGGISVDRGTFRIPGTRAVFTRTTGSVDFAENQKAGNPDLDVTSDADYRDLQGQDHVITLTIKGRLDQNPQWDLKTSTGYNKAQTLALLVLGRNQEQLRRSLGDQTIGIDPTHVDPTTNPTSGAADQIVKDLAGDWVSSLLGSSLTRLTGFDVVRFELGFGSVGIHVEKKAYENITLIGEGEQTIRGNTINAKALSHAVEAARQLGRSISLQATGVPEELQRSRRAGHLGRQASSSCTSSSFRDDALGAVAICAWSRRLRGPSARSPGAAGRAADVRPPSDASAAQPLRGRCTAVVCGGSQANGTPAIDTTPGAYVTPRDAASGADRRRGTTSTVGRPLLDRRVDRARADRPGVRRAADRARARALARHRGGRRQRTATS